jgi:hypothetical protein
MRHFSAAAPPIRIGTAFLPFFCGVAQPFVNYRELFQQAKKVTPLNQSIKT